MVKVVDCLSNLNKIEEKNRGHNDKLGPEKGGLNRTENGVENVGNASPRKDIKEDESKELKEWQSVIP